MESERSNNNGLIWLLPEMEEDRSEPVLEMRHHKDNTFPCSTKIYKEASSQASKVDFIGWYVFFSQPSESSKFITANKHLKNVFSPLSEPSTVNIFRQCPEDEEKKKKHKEKGKEQEKKEELKEEKERKHREKGKEQEKKKARLKHKLMKQEYGQNKNFNLLEYAYRLMKQEHGSSIVSVNNAIFNQRTRSGNTVLHLAASYGNGAMVEKVAEHDSKLFTVVNNNYDTALHVAARTGHGSTIQLLLNKFLDFVRRVTTGHDHQSILEIMLMVSLTLFRNKQGNTFFHEAFMTSSHNGGVIFKAFKDDSGFEASFKRIVYHLLPFAVNMEGKSLLYLAVEANRKEVVRYCLRGELKPQGKSPLLPTLIKKNLDMLETILAKKPDWIHLANEHGWLPLHHAVLCGDFQGVCHLVKKCPSCTMEWDNNGSLPIHLACIKGHVKIVEELLKMCLDLEDIVNDRGQNVLHVACACGNYELVMFLLKHPQLEMKMINQKDTEGNTPLHLATIFLHPKIVYALTWDNRVDLSLLDHRNRTALDIAEQCQDSSVSLSQRLTWNALKSARTPRSSLRLYSDGGTKIPSNEKHTTEQYKDRIDILIVVTLIITTSFTAGFTFRGDIDQGIPVLLNRPMFHLFILSLTISVFGAISSAIIRMWARLGDLHLAVFSLTWAIPLLVLSLTMLSLALLSGIYLLVSKLSWLASIFLLIVVVLILMVVFSYLLLLLPSSSTLPFFRHVSYYSFLFFANIAEGKMDANKMGSEAITDVV